MQPLPNAPQALKVVYSGTYLATDWVNVGYLIYSATQPVDADLATLAGGLRTAWAAAFQSLLGSQVALTNVTVQDVSRNPGAIGVSSSTTTCAGGATAMPANVSVCVTKKVARRYRGGHPRMYLTGIVAAHTADGRSLTGAILPTYQAAANTFFTQTNALSSTSTGTVKMANVGYYYVPTPHAKPIVRTSPIVELISACTVNSRLDSQRRRLG